MLRLTLVFFIWIASTAYAVEECDPDHELALHEAYVRAWSEADEERRELLAKAQRGWNLYRAANCALLGEECHGLMAQDRAAELRYILDGLTETNGRTILPAYGRAERNDPRGTD